MMDYVPGVLRDASGTVPSMRVPYGVFGFVGGSAVARATPAGRLLELRRGLLLSSGRAGKVQFHEGR